MNRHKYALARERLDSGKWRVDADSGLIYGDRSSIPLGAITKNSGYVTVAIGQAESVLRCYVHVVIWESMNGPVPDGLEVNHKNGVKGDNRLSNLELVTASGNMRHAYEIGLSHGRKGEAHHKARLTEDDVRDIRHRAACGHPQKDLAAEYDIARGQISAIVNRTKWTHV